MTVFAYDDYKLWVREKLSSMPLGGRGQFKRIADYLATSPTIVTQVFRGNRELTPEQALLLADYYALSKAEGRFLVLLVNFARAGTHRYKQNLYEQILEQREKSHEISSRVKQNTEMSEEAKTVLYSNWYYLAIWSLTAIDHCNDLETISNRLRLPRKKVREVLDFLVEHGMVIENDQGKFRVGPNLVHLASGSPQLSRHHQNWRLQAFKRYEDPQASEAFYTAPVTLSEKDAVKVRENVLKFISENVTLIQDSPSEKFYCLCLDWFEVLP